jgi:putative ABC transport system substrate-binding protein
MRAGTPELIVALTLILHAAPLAAEAQPVVHRVGILAAPPLSSMTFPQQFPAALRDLGYVEKHNIVLEWRSADGRPDHLSNLAAELVRIKVDVIVAMTNADIVAATRATTKIPIVMVAAQDPVGAGIVVSLARPGGNVTGRTFLGPETAGKLLEVLKETVPGISRVMHLGSAAIPSVAANLKSAESAARALGLTMQAVELRPSDDVARVLGEIRRWQPHALYVMPVGIPARHRDAILKFAVDHRMPAVYGARGMVELGGLMVYLPSALESARRVAWYVDRILKGTLPADLPVEQPQKYDLVINLKTAKAMGLTIPQSILLRADELIE